ncbi:MAG TPA: uroporphyrinogen-III synthase, partial [Longimicrobiales bacterium]|nr:uroporphyrinogen-III synthase [Longimicrobiales bacterium]
AGAGAGAGAGPRVGCVGEATAEAARRAGWEPAVVPAEASGEALGRALVAAGVGAGTRVLFPRAEDAREALRRSLEAVGAAVDAPVAYRKGVPAPADAGLRRLIADGGIDLLTFTSPATARNFVGELGEAAAGMPAVVIGATTAAAARSLGLRVVAVAGESTTGALIAAAVEALHAQGTHG